MATPTDNLSPPPAPSRVSYSLGRMLGVEDFQADQDYHRSSLARALLQLCGTGTVSGLNVLVPQVWSANTPYAAFAFVYDANQNVQVNTGAAGLSGAAPVTFAAAAGGAAVKDGANIAWTNEGPIVTAGWRPNTTFAAPTAIVDSNANVQILTAASSLTSGPLAPVWNTSLGMITSDGSPPVPAWTCVGPQQLEVAVTAGLAIDRVGRMIEVPQTVCIYLQPWMASQSASDLNLALHGGNIVADVFATFVPCTQGVTPCFATQDDYDATDAFAANRLLDSFAMQLVLRTDQNPLLPQDPWLGAGPTPTGGVTSTVVQALQQNILSANAGAAAGAPFTTTGPIPAEYPPGFDASSVFLARLSIPATAPATQGQAPAFNLNTITINNLARLFIYAPSLVARTLGLNSGRES
jgi:hypothetical protein